MRSPAERLDITTTYVPRKSTLTRSYYTIKFELDPLTMSLAYMQFQNQFCASIVIDQLIHDSRGGDTENRRWRTVVRRRVLMRDPHTEEDAHAWIVVSATEFKALEWNRSGEQELRIYIEQPSPAWRHYKLRGVTLWACPCSIDGGDARAAPFAITATDAALVRLLDAEVHLARCFERVAIMRRAHDAAALPSDAFVRTYLSADQRRT